MHSRKYLFVGPVIRNLMKSCFQKMDGRFFAGRRIEASLYSGKQRFRRSGTGDEIDGHGDDAEKKRLDNFAQWLMTEED